MKILLKSMSRHAKPIYYRSEFTENFLIYELNLYIEKLKHMISKYKKLFLYQNFNQDLENQQIGGLHAIL